jgi:hypothetical protein
MRRLWSFPRTHVSGAKLWKQKCLFVEGSLWRHGSSFIRFRASAVRKTSLFSSNSFRRYARLSEAVRKGLGSRGPILVRTTSKEGIEKAFTNSPCFKEHPFFLDKAIEEGRPS